MKLLDFTLPPFCRIIFPDKKIKEKWEPIIEKARKAYNSLEILTVAYGLRDCGTVHLIPTNRENQLRELDKLGLKFVSILKSKYFRGFSDKFVEPSANDNENVVYGAISLDEAKAEKFRDIQLNINQIGHDAHKELGRLLGFPDCCLDHFVENFSKKRIVDTVWQTAQNTDTDKPYRFLDEHTIRLKNEFPLVNHLLRSFGIRLLSHIPCSFKCEESNLIALKWAELGKKLEIDGVDELIQLLKLPIEWDALKGIAYISTPLFKIETNTVACYPKYVVQLEGSYFPEEAPEAMKFPWTERYKINGDKIKRMKLKEKENK